MEFLLPAVLLGIKHSFDADHLLAVSNMLVKARSPAEAARLSLSWCAGHMGGALLVTVLLFLFRDSLLSLILESFETLVALTLVAFGFLGLYQAIALHSHGHSHGGGAHSHTHMHLRGSERDHSHAHIAGIGVVQGLASNDELLLLLTVFLGLSSLTDMLFGVLFFTAGVAAGMVLFASAFSIPLLRNRSVAISRAVNFAVGAGSAGYGALILLGAQ
ncbi:MAG: hypothetical protein AB1324_01230 [Candidatus Micrarchaeota archaeon]